MSLREYRFLNTDANPRKVQRVIVKNEIGAYYRRRRLIRTNPVQRSRALEEELVLEADPGRPEVQGQRDDAFDPLGEQLLEVHPQVGVASGVERDLEAHRRVVAALLVAGLLAARACVWGLERSQGENRSY